MMDAFICDAIRTPIGRYGGALSSVRPDDLAALAIKALLRRNSQVEPGLVDEVVLGCANQVGEDSRNVARMAALLSGLPQSVAAVTLNRLCGSGMDAVGYTARTLHAGEAKIVIAGGVESMSRAPFVIPKADQAFSRSMEIYDTTIGWRFINPELRRRFGVDSMPETAENVARHYKISREDQDAFALASQSKAAAAQRDGAFDAEIVPVEIAQRRGPSIVIDKDEHPRATTLSQLSSLPSIVSSDGSITAGNASGVNDGAASLLLASEAGLSELGVSPFARILGMATAGVEPSVMGIGPIPATQKLLKQLRLTMDDFDLIELNEAFAAQALAVLRGLSLSDDDRRVNPNGGAIALGHPLGMSGARLVGSAAHTLKRTGGRLALCTMCVGVGQGIAIAIERV
ncbi:3-oxoadipyl-CoA thiolase [Pseudomonas sp. ZM23]|uniref:Beta-ketoadipyl-CoA thiolase n=1 Tax=Pseudomonas triclosanedens TaxID=2961893 RepID=A0ABY7A2M7_9PSED|nr:3-oxoadipyl-CoA thiolase [Pseudomonas triclosanedens]MCP8463671.1 3-oxoadipyl-CoA thiolase [Pseudomonas triclosanedens]MCP8468755.1 3-oxoadipyl-CoA thiolase [Pseudomonas triclosanedens]MCP8475477.1 3-oxoadipyl-CoA thiolase [Pseudomonas triclosanedens]WAI50801.1 3-oxoadipyl-CoA thiolase [Pseudomonas triclosanedens]